MADDTAPYRPRCCNLTCKSMAVYGEEFESDPEYQAGNAEMTCLCTSMPYGPDSQLVSLELCSDPARDCYREY